MPSVSCRPTAKKPMVSDKREPYRMVEKMSRPCSSVPNKKCSLPPSIHEGGSSASIISIDERSYGLVGAIKGALIATMTNSTNTAKLLIATLSRRK
ncbi:Uncharacterised protein [Vibrio cholerae]|nr:Uncharacterised protein [Vibrio cholerae]